LTWVALEWLSAAMGVPDSSLAASLWRSLVTGSFFRRFKVVISGDNLSNCDPLRVAKLDLIRSIGVGLDDEAEITLSHPFVRKAFGTHPNTTVLLKGHNLPRIPRKWCVEFDGTIGLDHPTRLHIAGFSCRISDPWQFDLDVDPLPV